MLTYNFYIIFTKRRITSINEFHGYLLIQDWIQHSKNIKTKKKNQIDEQNLNS